MRRLLLALAVLTCTAAFAHEELGLSEAEFKMYRQYKNALEDSRVQAMKPEARLGAIAKNAGFKVPELKKAIEKGDAAGDLKAKCEGNLKEAFADGTLAGRVGRLEVDTGAAQAVAYVQWFNEEQKNLPMEASFAAVKAAEACPIASTITVWAQDKGAPKLRVFQALISAESAKRINVAKLADFAETRYMKLFEKVKSAAKGDDLAAESGTPAGQP